MHTGVENLPAPSRWQHDSPDSERQQFSNLLDEAGIVLSDLALSAHAFFIFISFKLAQEYNSIRFGIILIIRTDKS